MAPAPSPRILLAGDPAPADARAVLEAVGFAVSPTGLGGIDPAEVARSQAVLRGHSEGAVDRPGPVPPVADRAGRAVRADRLAGGGRRPGPGRARRRGRHGPAAARCARPCRRPAEGPAARPAPARPAGQPGGRGPEPEPEAPAGVPADRRGSGTDPAHPPRVSAADPAGSRPGPVRRRATGRGAGSAATSTTSSGWTRSTSACTWPTPWAAGCRPAAC